jgi:predicted RNase H-like nuclease
MSALRSHLRGWAANNFGIYKQQKGNLISTIDNLDIQEESRDLTVLERNELSHAQGHLAKLLCEEEVKYYQRAKVTNVLLGDNNTKYF